MPTITPRELSLLVYQDADSIEATDEAALFLIERVEQLVLPKAGLAPNELLADIPIKIRYDVQRIVLNVCARTWVNPQLLQRRAVGPLSRSWFESNVTGLSLRPGEVEELAGFIPDSSEFGDLWVIETTRQRETPGNTYVRYKVDGALANTIEHGDPFPLYAPGEP